MSAASFVVILPVKPPALGKSRLRGLPDAQRRDLAAAFARDTAAAARRTPGVVAVLAVTDDFSFAGELAEDGCEVIPDGVSQDLNATLRQAAASEGALHLITVAGLIVLPGVIAYQVWSYWVFRQRVATGFGPRAERRVAASR